MFFESKWSPNCTISNRMRCCRSDWPGLCLFCCYQPLCVVSQELIWAFLLHQLSNFTPPPPQAHHLINAILRTWAPEKLAKIDGIRQVCSYPSGLVFFKLLLSILTSRVLCYDVLSTFLFLLHKPVFTPLRLLLESWRTLSVTWPDCRHFKRLRVRLANSLTLPKVPRPLIETV